MSDKLILPDVLLLSENEEFASVDKRALKDCGVPQVHVLTSGTRAARVLADRSLKEMGLVQNIIVVCGQRMADMDGENFCNILRLHPRLLSLPILLILANDSELDQIRTLGCGASALLSRPYSIPDLKAVLTSLALYKTAATQLKEGEQLADTESFDAALATYGQLLKPVRRPEDYFYVGMQCLRQKKWNSSITAFQRALSSQIIKGEAELGIAVAWKGKGNMANFKAWLAQAAKMFVSAGRWHRARIAYARLVREDPEAKNPFFLHANEMIRQNRYEEAVDVLLQSVDVTPKETLHEKLAGACLLADDPERMLQILQTGLEHVADLKDKPRLTSQIRSELNVQNQRREESRRQASEKRIEALSRKLLPQQQIEEEEEQEKAFTGGSSGKAIAEFTLTPAKSSLFKDILTVVKCTWQLLRGIR